MKIVFVFFFSFVCMSIVGQTFDLNSSKYEVGEVYTPNFILFQLAKPEIHELSFPILDSISVFLKNNPKLIIEVGVHNDGRQSKKASYYLTFVRAKEIVSYLINKEVEVGRLSFKGYEFSKPLISSEEITKMGSDEEKQKAHHTNRRVEFVILKILE